MHTVRVNQGNRLWLRFRLMPPVVALLLLCSMVGASQLAAFPASDKKYFDIIRSVDLFGEVYREVSASYVDRLDTTQLMYAGIDGMLHSLDPYTVFLDEENSGELDEITHGKYVGVGISLASLDGAVLVTSVTDSHPAAKAGVRIGDSILAINNKEVKKLSLADVKAMLKGVAGTSVTFTIERPGVPTFTIRLTREEVKVNTVNHAALVQGTGYIEMKSFTGRSASELRTTCQELQQQAKNQHIRLKGIILDLRNNPGGLLDAAVDVTSQFVPKGSKVVSIRGQSLPAEKSYTTKIPPLDTAMPLVVLINSESASAAEIVSGAIQDMDRGVIIGERSFGKGLVQSVVRISYNHTLKITTAKYYTPSGRLIQKERKIAQEKRKVLPKVSGQNLSQVFYTKSRRKVYGGGGIMPDIEVTVQHPPYLSELRRKGLLFLFSNKYCASHSVMPLFPLDRPRLMASFDDFLKSQKFEYSSELERRFNELKESMKKAAENPANTTAKNSLDVLRLDVERLKQQEIERESAPVAQALEVEIFRHYNTRLARKIELDNDAEVKKAVEILSDSGKYFSLLQP